MTDIESKRRTRARNDSPRQPGGRKKSAGRVVPGKMDSGPHAALLREAAVRPTRQRQALAALLFGKGVRHLTADELCAEASAAGLRVSQATVYNTLNQFLAAGLLRYVVIDVNRAYFDTNPRPHHHFYLEEAGTLIDIADSGLALTGFPEVPEGTELARVDVIIRIKSRT
jgi:Fur family transcriptional regulator, iron response regulator